MAWDRPTPDMCVHFPSGVEGLHFRPYGKWILPNTDSTTSNTKSNCTRARQEGPDTGTRASAILNFERPDAPSRWCRGTAAVHKSHSRSTQAPHHLTLPYHSKLPLLHSAISLPVRQVRRKRLVKSYYPCTIPQSTASPCDVQHDRFVQVARISQHQRRIAPARFGDVALTQIDVRMRRRPRAHSFFCQRRIFA